MTSEERAQKFAIMMMCHYPDLGSGSDWSKICLNQSEELTSSGFLQSFLRCHFTGKLLVILRDVGCFLKLPVISINKPLRTNAQVQVCLNGLLW